LERGGKLVTENVRFWKEGGTSEFDVEARKMKYQIFITKPYDALVTENVRFWKEGVRFWKEGGINLTLSSRGASLDVPVK